MRYIIAVLGFFLVLIVLWDAFETIISPRRITTRFRFARLFYSVTWWSRSDMARWIKDAKRRETYLSIFGPLSLLVLFSVWTMGLVVGFAMLHWGLKLPLNVPENVAGFGAYLYMSGTTFFTLGLGDLTPLQPLGRALVAVEAGVGFGFLGANMSYLPMLYQAYSRREVTISLFNERAGSPPTAGELLRRHGQDRRSLEPLLHEWERWSAEVLDSHLSYPFLAYFRSQHVNQSWLAALTTILDACALVMSGADGPTRQAQLTFAMTRHATVGLAQIFTGSPRSLGVNRLPSSAFAALRNNLAEEGFTLDISAEQKLRDLRQTYEPYVEALSEYFSMTLPGWFSVGATSDPWPLSPSEKFLMRMQHPTCAHGPEMNTRVSNDIGGSEMI